ncbi:MAG: hypothetical protein QM769_03220 [Pseudoxanthomonas sp.]
MAIPPSPFWLLRRAIDKHLKTSAALESFLRDFFPRVAFELSPTMERTAQVNLLFTYASAPDVLRALEVLLADHPAALAALHADLGFTAAPRVQEPPPAVLPPAWVPRPPPAWIPQAAAGGPRSGSYEPQPPLVFIEYADEDLELVNELMLQLTPLVNTQRLRVFARAQLAAGADGPAATATQLAQAAVIVPLLSPHLLASERFAEFLRATQQLVGCRIVPLLARPVLWEQSPLGNLAPLPPTRRFLSSMERREREHALVEIARQLGELARVA